MDHMYNTRPDFQIIVDKQRLAHYRLHKDATTRIPAERANYERVLHPVPLDDLNLPKVPLVRPHMDYGSEMVVLGEIAQRPGMVVVLNTTNNVVSVMHAADLELVPPSVSV